MARHEPSACARCANHPIVNGCIRFFRWLPVIFIIAVVIWSYYAYTVALCYDTVPYLLEKIFYLLPYHVILFLFLSSYYQCTFSRIARPDKRFHLPRPVLTEVHEANSPEEERRVLDRFARDKDLPVQMRGFDGSVRYCPKCECIKPDRCHHCSVCGHCILKFDHHCPWVNTCINYANYKFFVQFLGYSLLMCLWVFFTDMRYFIQFWQDEAGRNRARNFHIMFMFFVSGMFAVSVSTLFFYHLWLTCKNRSTLESFRSPIFTYGNDKNGFNLGCARNFREVFGDSCALWFIPLFSSRGDGHIYETPIFDVEAKALLKNSSNHALIDENLSDSENAEDETPLSPTTTPVDIRNSTSLHENDNHNHLEKIPLTEIKTPIST